MQLQSTISRHKRKIYALLGVGILLGGIYFGAQRLFKAGMKKVEEMGKEIEVSMLKERKKQEEMVRIRHESEEALKLFLPSLIRLLKSLTDTKILTEELKTLRRERLRNEDRMAELWENLKISVLSRTFSVFYSVAILKLLVHANFHIVSRVSFESEKAITSQVRQKLLLILAQSLIDDSSALEAFMFELNILLKEGSTDWKMGSDQVISNEMLKDKLASLHTSVKNSTCLQVFIRSLIETIESKSSTLNSENATLIHETLDAVESPLFEESFMETSTCMIRSFCESMNENTADFMTKAKKGTEYILTKLLVGLTKEVPSLVSKESFLKKLGEGEVFNSLNKQLFFEEEDSKADEGASFGLEGFGLTQDDIKSFQGLLSGDESEMMKLLQQIGSQDNINQLAQN